MFFIDSKWEGALLIMLNLETRKFPPNEEKQVAKA